MTTKKAAGSASRRPKAAKKVSAKNRVKLLPRQVKLVEGLAQGKSVRRAAIEAGYSPRTAAHPADVLETKAVRAALSDLLAPVEKIALRLNEGLDAQRTEFAKFEGRISDSINCVDFEQRRKYAETIARIKGAMPGDELEISGDVTQKVQIEFINVAALAEP